MSTTVNDGWVAKTMNAPAGKLRRFMTTWPVHDACTRAARTPRRRSLLTDTAVFPSRPLHLHLHPSSLFPTAMFAAARSSIAKQSIRVHIYSVQF